MLGLYIDEDGVYPCTANARILVGWRSDDDISEDDLDEAERISLRRIR